jgi:hypothetical protein
MPESPQSRLNPLRNLSILILSLHLLLGPPPPRSVYCKLGALKWKPLCTDQHLRGRTRRCVRTTRAQEGTGGGGGGLRHGLSLVHMAVAGTHSTLPNTEYFLSIQRTLTSYCARRSLVLTYKKLASCPQCICVSPVTYGLATQCICMFPVTYGLPTQCICVSCDVRTAHTVDLRVPCDVRTAHSVSVCLL